MSDDQRPQALHSAATCKCGHDKRLHFPMKGNARIDECNSSDHGHNRCECRGYTPASEAPPTRDDGFESLMEELVFATVPIGFVAQLPGESRKWPEIEAAKAKLREYVDGLRAPQAYGADTQRLDWLEAALHSDKGDWGFDFFGSTDGKNVALRIRSTALDVEGESLRDAIDKARGAPAYTSEHQQAEMERVTDLVLEAMKDQHQAQTEAGIHGVARTIAREIVRGTAANAATPQREDHQDEAIKQQLDRIRSAGYGSAAALFDDLWGERDHYREVSESNGRQLHEAYAELRELRATRDFYDRIYASVDRTCWPAQSTPALSATPQREQIAEAICEALSVTDGTIWPLLADYDRKQYLHAADAVIALRAGVAFKAAVQQEQSNNSTEDGSR